MTAETLLSVGVNVRTVYSIVKYANILTQATANEAEGYNVFHGSWWNVTVSFRWIFTADIIFVLGQPKIHGALYCVWYDKLKCGLTEVTTNTTEKTDRN